MYYELVDLAFDLDLGLTARVLTASSPLMASLKENAVLPMLYAAAGRPTLFQHLAGDINGLGFNGASVMDTPLKLGGK